MDCSICQETISNENGNADLECGHDFHIECVRNLRNPSCPVCRESIKSPKINDFEIKIMVDRRDNDKREIEESYISPIRRRLIARYFIQTGSLPADLLRAEVGDEEAERLLAPICPPHTT